MVSDGVEVAIGGLWREACGDIDIAMAVETFLDGHGLCLCLCA